MNVNCKPNLIFYLVLHCYLIHVTCQQKQNLQKINQGSLRKVVKQQKILANSSLNNSSLNNSSNNPQQYIIIVQRQSQLHAQLANKDDPTYSLEFQKNLYSVPIIKKQQIPRSKLISISKGWFSKVYLWQQRNLIVKLYKKKIIVAIRQLKNLVIVNQIYPNFLRYIIVSQKKMVGFILQRAIGRTSNSSYLQQDNVFHYNMTAKLHLIQLIRQEVRKMQNFKLVHADIFPQNFIVDQKDKNDSNVTIKVIDFGNSYVFSYDKLVNIRIGVYVRPPQYRKNNQYYNASGVNAYQFGMCSLMILTNQGSPNPLKPLNNRQKAFDQLRQKGLTQNQVKYFKALFHKDIDIRNAALFSQPDTFIKKFSSRLQQQIFNQRKQNQNKAAAKTQKIQENTQIQQQNCQQLFNQ